MFPNPLLPYSIIIIFLIIMMLPYTNSKFPNIKRGIPLLHIRGGGANDNTNNNNNRGFKSEFIVGKDRELFHISIDLKWLYDSITDKSMWYGIFCNLMERIRKYNPTYKYESDYKKSAYLYAKNIHTHRSNSTLRVFSSSLLQAQKLAIETGRYIAYYCEEDMVGIMPTYLTLAFRRALTDNNVEDLLNEQFIFMASDIMHPYADEVVKLAKSAGLNQTTFDFPLLIILSPKKKLTSSKNFPTMRKRSFFSKKEPIELDVLGMVSLNGQDITGYYLYEFLLTILHVHNNRRNNSDTDEEDSDDNKSSNSIVRSEAENNSLYFPEVMELE